MRRDEWVRCRNIQVMIHTLAIDLTQRKIRLSACGMVRQVIGILQTAEGVQILADMEESVFNGHATRYEFGLEVSLRAKSLRQSTERRILQRTPERDRMDVGWAVADILGVGPAFWNRKYGVGGLSRIKVRRKDWPVPVPGNPEHLFHPVNTRVQADIFREVVGWPGRLPPPSMWARLRKWENGLILETGRSIAGGRRWADMGVLGDMLEDARCEDADVVEHC